MDNTGVGNSPWAYVAVSIVVIVILQAVLYILDYLKDKEPKKESIVKSKMSIELFVYLGNRDMRRCVLFWLRVFGKKFLIICFAMKIAHRPRRDFCYIWRTTRCAVTCLFDLLSLPGYVRDKLFVRFLRWSASVVCRVHSPYLFHNWSVFFCQKLLQ